VLTELLASGALLVLRYAPSPQFQTTSSCVNTARHHHITQ
jgi:hypothetical protein